MKKRTFEIVSKYIADATHVNIAFDNPQGASVDLETNTLHLPEKISDEKALGALAMTMHEAAHVAHSKVIPKEKVIDTQSEFNILNAMEDIRIDTKNFSVLPNIREFYNVLCEKACKIKESKAPLPVKYLVAGILYNENMYIDELASDMDEKVFWKVVQSLQKGINHIENKEWDKLKDTIKKVKKVLKIDETKDPKWEPKKGKGQEGQVDGGELGDLEKELHGDAFGQGDKDMEGESGTATSPAALREQTVNKFKELLNVKERRVVNEGNILDTDNLVAYFTDDVKELFKEQKVVKAKKSKIVFLLDASGSMSQAMMDNNSRAMVVASCVKKLTEILDEVIAIEGINVSWEVGAFQTTYYKLDRTNWMHEYRPAGGTNLEYSMKVCLEELSKDYTVDGKKMLIVFTDGDVDDREIENVKKMIIASTSDIRCLIIAVGANVHGAIAKEIVGDNIIFAKEGADEVLINTIEQML